MKAEYNYYIVIVYSYYNYYNYYVPKPQNIQFSEHL